MQFALKVIVGVCVHKEDDYGTPVGHHFSQVDRSLNDMNVLVILKILRKKTIELKMIKTLKTTDLPFRFPFQMLHFCSSLIVSSAFLPNFPA